MTRFGKFSPLCAKKLVFGNFMCQFFVLFWHHCYAIGQMIIVLMWPSGITGGIMVSLFSSKSDGLSSKNGLDRFGPLKSRPLVYLNWTNL